MAWRLLFLSGALSVVVVVVVLLLLALLFYGVFGGVAGCWFLVLVFDYGNNDALVVA